VELNQYKTLIDIKFLLEDNLKEQRRIRWLLDRQSVNEDWEYGEGAPE